MWKLDVKPVVFFCHLAIEAPPSWFDCINIAHEHIFDSYWDHSVFCVRFTEIYSQSGLSVTGMSNACVLISLTTCFWAHRRTLRVDMTSKYIAAIEYGNMLYDRVTQREHPNYFVEEALRTFNFDMELVSELPYWDYEEMAPALLQTANAEKREVTRAGLKSHLETYVLLVPPDKAMTVIIDDNEIAVLDSHAHGVYGGLILVAKLEKTAVAFDVLRKMLAEAFDVPSFGGCWLNRVRPRI